ncbi:hypothetical protein [Funiculus sociatus]
MEAYHLPVSSAYREDAIALPLKTPSSGKGDRHNEVMVSLCFSGVM